MDKKLKTNQGSYIVIYDPWINEEIHSDSYTPKLCWGVGSNINQMSEIIDIKSPALHAM